METSNNENIKLNINDQLFLETLLLMIRGNTIKFSARKKRESKQEEEKLEKEIKQLEEEINTNCLNTEYNKIELLEQNKSKLINIRKQKIEGVMLRSKSRYQELGEKPTNYFLNLENRNYTNQSHK